VHLPPVWLEALPAQFIDRTAIDARADGQFSVEVYLGGRLESPARIAGQIENLDNAPLGAPFVADLPPGRRERPSAKLDNIMPWTAETPNLYRIRLTLTPDRTAWVHTLTRRSLRRIRAASSARFGRPQYHKRSVNRKSTAQLWPESTPHAQPARSARPTRGDPRK